MINRQEAITAVSNNGLALRRVSTSLQNDREVVRLAVAQNGLALEYASDRLKEDKEVVTTAVAQNGQALVFASYSLKRDKDLSLAVVARNARVLRRVSRMLRKDKDVAQTLRNGTKTARLKTDSDFVLAVAGKYGVLGCVSGSLSDKAETDSPKADKPGLKDDKDVVRAAVCQNGLGLKYASDSLKGDKDVVLSAVAQTGLALRHASKELQDDMDVVVAALATGVSAVPWVGPATLAEMRRLWLSAVRDDKTARGVQRETDEISALKAALKASERHVDDLTERNQQLCRDNLALGHELEALQHSSERTQGRKRRVSEDNQQPNKRHAEASL